MQSGRDILVLATGGTIAGAADRPDDTAGYTAGVVGVEDLVSAVPPLAAWPLRMEQLAQVDSKDMDFALWYRLAQRIDAALADSSIAGIVVTHGTDTLEETAYFLHRLLGPAKPVVLTAAMRPATALSADGPQNLLDAVRVAAHPEACGVLAVIGGAVHSGLDVRKAHASHVQAFDSADAGPVAWIEAGELRLLRPWPKTPALGLTIWPDGGWPSVHIVTSTAGADGQLVDALVGLGVDGIVVAGTGGGTVHQALTEALTRAVRAGVSVWRASRCGVGRVRPLPPPHLPAACVVSPVKARIELMLQLLAGTPRPVVPG